MSRTSYIDVMERYFRGVTEENLAAIRACFTHDARVTIYHGDSAQRQFHVQPRTGGERIEDFYGHIWRNFHIRFDDFTWVVDEVSAVCSAIFVPTLTPKPGSAHASQGVLTLRNCNFFWFRDGLAFDTVIYYANPALGARLGLGTAPVTVPPR